MKTPHKQEGICRPGREPCAASESQEHGRGEVARGVLTSLPGDSVTLTCPGVEPEDNATVHWVLRKPAAGSHPSRWAGMGRRLLLRSVQLHDSGNYSCYRAGRPAGTVHLLVDVPPEEPQLSCFRKSPLSNVVCEWGPRSTPSLTTKAVLLVRKFQNSPAEDFQEPCQYSQESQKFSCQLAVPEGDSSFYIVSMCVASSVGSKFSKTQTFQGCGILQPDPPANITVTAVARNPRWLSVTWQDPHSWNSSFYRLRFELRYRAERSKTFTTWMASLHRPSRVAFGTQLENPGVLQLRTRCPPPCRHLLLIKTMIIFSSEILQMRQASQVQEDVEAAGSEGRQDKHASAVLFGAAGPGEASTHPSACSSHLPTGVPQQPGV
ncbi:interleukin-6 receptor subunit alpha isoform X16 [Homo sapiens]|uniref:interleukin-6 receptor subunit alpha isoform X16 n=1 Tax=Homo sapiens TaxID=9606 RepID=UPI0023DFDF98|nr:interleukin-6 receptor subunit alpha isoform X16 [Homo sapiens]